MKKLALALVCFASVAFMASCVKTIEHPEPSIAVMTGEDYVYDGQTVDLNVNYKVGFHAASNSQTQKELASFNLAASLYELDGTLIESRDSTYVISGTEYDHQEGLNFNFTNTRDLVGKVSITGTVTDVDGKRNAVTINLNINQPAITLEIEPINWVKTGHNEQDLSAYGLVWEKNNYKSPFTHIVPAEGSTLYLIENGDEVFNSIVTDIDLNNKFAELAETGRPIDDYKNVDCNASKDYHDLLIVKEANGKLHAINITHATITTPSGLGTRITITGQAK
jgi:hypothetical protein